MLKRRKKEQNKKRGEKRGKRKKGKKERKKGRENAVLCCKMRYSECKIITKKSPEIVMVRSQRMIFRMVLKLLLIMLMSSQDLS